MTSLVGRRFGRLKVTGLSPGSVPGVSHPPASAIPTGVAFASKNNKRRMTSNEHPQAAIRRML